MTMDKKTAAAISAVMAYIRTEEDAVILTGASAAEEAAAPAAPAVMPAPAKPWGYSGRQDNMHLRTMMQLKAFHGGRQR